MAVRKTSAWERPPSETNPRRGPDLGSDSGDESMTAAQASCLKMLAEQALEPEAFSAKLTRAEASRRIAALKAKLRLQDGPPHTL